MLSLTRLLTAVAVFSIFVTFPMAGRCDTSYYEKYYSARRPPPLKRNTLVEYNFTVRLTRDYLVNFEQVAVVGDVKQLGSWSAQRAVILNRTQDHNVWSATVQLPMNSTVNYRYFIAAIDKETNAVQIRHWESHIQARHFNTTTITGSLSDSFGSISVEHEVQRGWLNAGNIVQFQLFRSPFRMYEQGLEQQRLLIKLQPIDPNTLTPILDSARAYTEYVRMTYGNSFLRTQPEYGVPYNDNDILIFHTTLSDSQRVAYLLKIYAAQSGSDLVRLVGYQHIKPDVLIGTEGKFNVDIISPIWLNTISSLELKYLVISPMPNSPVDFRTSFVDYWRANWTELDVGHRGLGKSLKQTTNSPPIIENTVASMKASGDIGTDLVEFDVQLTSDLVPVIYHDYSVWVCMDPKTPTSKDDLTEVLIKDITYEQLKNLKTYQIVGNKIVEYPAHNAVEQEDHRLFPLFEDFLRKVNKTIGFDIEIKWPQQKFNGEYESIQTIDKNLYIDRILDVMYRHGCGRLSFFTSFDADICSLLRFKQNMYPVMFLSSSKEHTYADPRSDTIYDTVNNAQAFDLAGIVPNAVLIQNNPRWIEVAKKQNKKIFLWGDVLKDTKSITWFKQQGPTGVIYDRLDLWLPIDKQNVFEQESDLPEFFLKQCPAFRFSDQRNATVDSILSNVNMI